MDLNAVQRVLLPRTRAEIPPWAPGTTVLAGGTWLFSEPQPQTRCLLDLSALHWTPIEIDHAGLHIAATCTIAELSRLQATPEWPAMALVQPCCEALLGSFKIWNAATVGGNICLALPAGPMIALAVALGGVATIWRGMQQILMPIQDLVLGDRRTALLDGDILRSLFLPRACLQHRTALRRISLTALGRSAALLIGTRDGAGRFAVTLTAATRRPIRLEFAGLPSARCLAATIDAEVTAHDLWFDDMHGAPDWRRQMSLNFAEDLWRELGGA